MTQEQMAGLRRLIGTKTMVDGYTSNTFGGVYESGGQLYILSLNTRTFRRNQRQPWLTPTSEENLALSLEEYNQGKPHSQYHLRFYGWATSAPTARAQQWAREGGYREVI